MIYPLGAFRGDASNKFCSLKNLNNESDVEQFFVVRLLEHLGYTEDYLKTKASLPEESIGKGRRRHKYVPDYMGYADRRKLRPILVVDAKSPLETAEEGVRDAQDYAAILHRRLEDPKPEIYCVGTSGLRTVVKHFDREKPEFDLVFDDFVDGNPKFDDFSALLSRASLTRVTTPVGATFEFKKPELAEIRGVFEACHDLIYTKDNLSPQAAFYEFSKLMFLKLREDKKLRDAPELKRLIDSRQPLPPEKIVFSVRTIVQNESVDPNPINLMLFRRLREDLEHEILLHRKKRIFDKGEDLELKPATVKEVVKHLEHYDLYGIDEDLNGRMFETFLGATMRGQALGQFFTPRSVVDFMTQLADIEVRANHVDTVIDLCCGTGGFLIEAMAIMSGEARKLKNLSGKERESVLRAIRDEQLVGVDAGKDPPIARIARINMYLHGDGGSHIYFADALDKQVEIEEGLEPELRAEREELQRLLGTKGHKFDVALSNPPFAKRYKWAEADAKVTMEQYALHWYKTKDGVRKVRSSIKSNIMFLERYSDVLKLGGKLCTVIDESVLNTPTDKEVRQFLLDNFLIKAIISLPQDAFERAGANVKTSVLFLVKKESPDEEQPIPSMGVVKTLGLLNQGQSQH